MDSEALSSMYAQILRGVPKEQSRFVTDDESSGLWDRVTAEVEAQRQVNPDTVFEIPSEIPGAPKTRSGDADGPAGSPADGEQRPATEGGEGDE